MHRNFNGVGKISIAAFLLVLVGVGAVLATTTTSNAPRADAVVILKAKGMSCGSCGAKIEKALKEKPGVAAVEVDVDNGRVLAAFDSASIKPEVIAETVTALGYASDIVQTLSVEQYRALAGRGVTAQNGNYGGCGGGCCNKNKKTN